MYIFVNYVIHKTLNYEKFRFKDLTFTIQRLDIDTIKLVIDTFLVTFAFENFENTDLFPQHDSQETVKHIEVGLLTQQTFDGPIKADIPILQFFSFILCHGKCR